MPEADDNPLAMSRFAVAGAAGMGTIAGTSLVGDRRVAVAEYQVMYWKEIPAQVRAKDATGGQAKQLLSQRFQLAIDTVAQAQGLSGTDDYLKHWHWGPR